MDTLESQLVEAIRNSKLDDVKILLNKGCKVNVGDSDGVTPLHLAAMRDHQEMVPLLLEHGANVNAKTLDKMTPLHYAACRGLAEMVELLIRLGAAVDSQDATDRTALIMAVSRQHLDVLETLIRHKAKVNMEEIHGYTPLCEAVWSKSVLMAETLLRAGAKPHHSQHLLHYTALHRHRDMAALLLRHGTYPNLRDDHGDTPLHLAINCCHLDMIRLLLQHGANPNCANSVNGITPLHQAIKCDATPAIFNDMLTLLCEYNVDLNQENVGMQMSPLANAILVGKLANVVSLIRAGADVNKSKFLHQLIFIVINYPSDAVNTTGLILSSEEVFIFLRLLVAAGYCLSRYCMVPAKDPTKVDISTIEGWLTHMKFNPQRLSDLCRQSIRTHMGNQVLQLVPTLEIPYCLKKFLLFDDICMFVKDVDFK